MKLKKIATIVALGTILIYSGHAQASGRKIGTFGKTYKIAEPDALDEIQKKAASVDWSKHINKEKIEASAKSFRPQGLKNLPRAKTNRSYVVDTRYTVEKDIKDANGRIMYPKGYTFDSMDYVKLNSVLVVIDGEDRDQVEWFKQTHAKDLRVRLILCNGDYQELIKELKRPVFYLVEGMGEKFKLQAVPAVVAQDGKRLVVSEVDIRAKK